MKTKIWTLIQAQRRISDWSQTYSGEGDSHQTAPHHAENNINLNGILSTTQLGLVRPQEYEPLHVLSTLSIVVNGHPNASLPNEIPQVLNVYPSLRNDPIKRLSERLSIILEPLS